MLKTKMRDLPVITMHMNPADKEALKAKATKKSMTLATYCRMVLLRDLESK